MKEKKVFGTYEWATANANFINGCIHNCKYCYSKEMAIRFKRKTPNNWAEEEINLNQLSRTIKKTDGYVMFPSSHDISPDNLVLSLTFLEKLLMAGNEILIVTKPHILVVESICKKFSRYRNKILFRFTIGSCISDTLKFWEPNAPSYEERMQSLRYAFDNGFKTSVSCEPILDTNTNQLIEKIIPFVTDAIWLGKPNNLKARLKINGYTDNETLKRAEKLIASLCDKWVFELYEVYKDNPKVKWKDSMKKVLGLYRPSEMGLDI
jgi:DNA repair photolyase